ncbi:uncharacterized protein LOC129572512 [Sitodiplosis mosellana]|uniref:uncharacterized protein LOC129572512 n=1 Tax=Sitodiplosis mosellana TaxID=263140 RepID=UPI002443D948|nr:uncharacterized protein LOC129572512 [Sitodiplosis mosellana]
MEQEDSFSKEDFADLQKSVSEIQNAIKNLEISKKRRDSLEDDGEEIFPLENLDELQMLENRLQKDNDFRKNLIRSLSRIGGTTGTGKYRKVADYMMKHCFDISLLQSFSFTGMSKNRNIPRRPAFVKYQATVRLIFNVVYRADRSYSFIKNEEYLQNYFKYVREKGVKRRRSTDEEEIFHAKGQRTSNNEIFVESQRGQII